MATTHHTVAAALLLVLGSFAATTPPADAAFPFGSASQAVPTLIPFPAGRFPHLGALQSLPALQCRLAAGVNGSFGASLGDTPFSRGRRTCAAPVVDVTEVIAVLGAHVQGRQRWTPDLAAQMAQQLRSMATQASNQSGLVVENAVFFPVHRRASDLTRDAGGGGDLRVDFRNGLANVLTLTRSTDSGAVWRHSGKYEVLAITSVVRGVCLTADCSVVAAVDTTGRGACSASACDTPHDSRDVAGRVDSEDAVTVVTHTSPRRGGGGPQPVSVVQLGLLGLGRAVHVARRWLISPPWDLTATVHTQLVTPPTRFEEFTHEPSLTSAWPLGGEAAAEAAKRDHVADAGGSEWLQKVAIALCHEPLPAYVDRRLCRGIAGNGQTPPTVKVSYNGAPEDLHVLRDALEPSTGAVWRVAPARHEATDAEPCAFADNLTAVRGADGAGRGPMEPPWMAGTLSREIHSRSPDEVELARSLGRCRLATGAAASGLAAIGSLRGREQLARHAAVVRLASSLHAGDYGDLEHPDDPASPTAKAEVLVLYVLGLGGLLAATPTTLPQDGRALAWAAARLSAVALVGSSALIPLYVLARRQREGDAWHAGTHRLAIHTAFPASAASCLGLPSACDGEGRGLRGTAILLSNMVSVTSTGGGYWTRGAAVFAGTTILYVCCFLSQLAIMAAPTAYRWLRTRVHAGNSSASSHSSGAPPPTAGGGGTPPPPPAVGGGAGDAAAVRLLEQPQGDPAAANDRPRRRATATTAPSSQVRNVSAVGGRAPEAAGGTALHRTRSAPTRPSAPAGTPAADAEGRS